MLRRIATVFAVLVFGSSIFAVSILRSADVKYSFAGEPSPSPDQAKIEINYMLPYPGRITPDSPLWSFKALRDKAWIMATFNSLKKAEIMLLMADKRIQQALALFESDKASLGVSTLTKAEKYLEEAKKQELVARGQRMNTGEFLERLANSSLKHRQITENILKIAPEEAKPEVAKTMNYSKKVFEDSRNSLIDVGKTAPANPFEK